MVRLNRFIALSGVASRRGAEKLILEGKIKVNNVINCDLSTKVDINRDCVTYLDEVLFIPENDFVYIKFNKPKGCICSKKDERGRKTVYNYLNAPEQKLFTVGRLDYNTEGLLLFTNDGKLANKLMHPSNNLKKKYFIKLDSKLSNSEILLLKNGVKLDDGYVTSPALIENYSDKGDKVFLFLTITEGKNRQIHRMFESINKRVLFLKRVEYGPILLGNIHRGKYKNLTSKEIYSLKKIF